MKNFGSAIGWGLNRITKSFGNIISGITGLHTPVRKGVIMCWAHNFKQYGCNPKALTEYLLENNPEFEIYWVFRRKIDISGLDDRIRCVRFRSRGYYKLVNEAEFLITNSRTDPYRIYWHKRPGQKYIMTWHGGVALKKVEMDVEDKLGYSYVAKAKIDSKACDLMLSGAKMQTRLISEKFWYSGEILQKGTPRCDIFFNRNMHEEFRKRVFGTYGIEEGTRIVLYAPTFRRDCSLEPYRIDWKAMLPQLERHFHTGNVKVLLRLHPNMLGHDTSSLLNDPAVIDVTRYHDMQELLCISDMLITDYSSSMFDFSMQMRPCILYAADADWYDRGFYFNLDELPYPLTRNQKELELAVSSFDSSRYQNDLRHFLECTVGLFEDGNACKALAEWMQEHSI